MTSTPAIDDLPAALAAKGFSQSELARVTGIDRSLINRYCHGLRATATNAAKIAEVLKTPVDRVTT
jgi:transcriptional regulator with XRE-family HTH domain